MIIRIPGNLHFDVKFMETVISVVYLIYIFGKKLSLHIHKSEDINLAMHLNDLNKHHPYIYFLPRD